MRGVLLDRGGRKVAHLGRSWRCGHLCRKAKRKKRKKKRQQSDMMNMASPGVYGVHGGHERRVYIEARRAAVKVAVPGPLLIERGGLGKDAYDKHISNGLE